MPPATQRQVVLRRRPTGLLAPGDKERKVKIERQAAGIPLDDETWSQIVAAAKRHGIDAESF